MKNILFVDDDPLVLQGLRRMLYPMRKEWEMRFANSGAEALAMLASRPADAVVSDMRMPVMNGAQLLNEVRRLYPQAIRIILSGYADTEMILQCVGGTHQFLSKPCDGETLRAAITRALELDRWISNATLKALIAQLKTIPSLPDLYYKIMRELNTPDVSQEKIGAIISHDVAMTAKMLQLVNSAFFGLPRRICDPREAVVQLGLEMVKSLVLAIHVFAEFPASGSSKLEMEDLHQHSLSTAITAKTVAELEGKNRNVAGEAFTAGLLHDIGKLVLLANFGDRCKEVCAACRRDERCITDAERAEFGVSHTEVGAYLLGLWGLPASLVEAAMFHHSPQSAQSREFTSLTAVHAADVFDRLPSRSLELFAARLNREYLDKAGCAARIPVWWQALNNSESPIAK